MKIKRCPLSKRVPRDLVKNCGKYLSMVLILVCTIAIGSSFQSALDGATVYLDDIKTDNVQEDGFFETADKIDCDDDFYEDKDVKVYENFYATENSFKAPIRNADGETVDKEKSKVIIFNERNEIDIPTIFEGELPKGENEIALDHVYARQKGIEVGDTLTLLKKDFKVSGKVSLPDYTSLFMNNTDLMMNTSHFCVAVVSKEAFDAFDEGSLTYRYSYRLKDRELDKSEKLDIAEDMQKHLIENGAILHTFLTSQQNQSISFLEMDMGTDGPFMVVFVYMLVALIAFVFAILTNNTIEKESVIIGTLLASGYKKSEIMWHYLQPTLIVAVVGSVVGNIIGYTAMIQPFLNLYYSTYSIGPIHIKFSVPAFIMTTVLPVVVMVVINCFMLMRKLSLKPLKFLRRDLKKKAQKKAVKLPNFKFLNRFRLRVIIQNKASYIMLFIGVFLASFLLMFGIGLDPLVDHYTESVNESLPFDYQYILKAPVDTDKGEKAYVYEMDTWFALAGKDIGVSLIGLDEDTEFFKGALDGGVGVASALAKKLNLEVGDTITLKDTAKDKEYELKIANVFDYNATMAVFMERVELNEMLDNDEDLYNCIYSNEEIDIDEMYLVKQIERDDLLGAASQMMDSFGTVILFINVFSVVVYIVLMYILTKVVIDKNAISISFMKVFGYNPKEIRKLYLTATTMVVVASLIICIPVEVMLFKVVLVVCSALIEGYLEFYLPNSVYVEIIVIGLVAYFVINAFHIGGIKKIAMTEALKNRE